MSAHSREGSNAYTGRTNRASSGLASASGGVVGLPGAFNDFIESDLSAANTALFDQFLDFDAYDTIGIDASNTFMANLNMTQHEHSNLNPVCLEQNLHNGLGIAISTKDSQPSPLDRVDMPYNHHSEVDQSQQESAPKDSARDIAYDSFSNYPDFGPWDTNFPMPMQPLDTTPGLSAIPGGNLFVPPLPAVDQQYPDSFNSLYPTGPYFNHPIQEYNNFVTIEPLHRDHVEKDVPQHNIDGIRPKSLQSSHKDDYFTPKPKPERNLALSDSESDEDLYAIKRRRQVKPVKHKRGGRSYFSRRDSAVSDNSSLGKPVKISVVRAGEKPKKCEDKSWVRINNSTKGETTRTARINQFTEDGSKYKIKPLSVGDWATDKFKFEYNHNNGMDEFKKHTMSSRQIHEYITEYPGEHLRIWIQVTPGDAARRYASKSHSHCLFEQCPNRVWANKGTIEVGSYRVAFDEKHKKYGKGVVDPFDCVGYAHLYCMERFLDFAGICEIVDVKVDTRGDMKNEPKGEASFIFSKKHVAERMLAEKFIKAAQLGQLGRTPEFCNYPIHTDYKKGEPKPHEHTLVSAMFNINWEHRPRSQLKQFVNRKILPTSGGVHRGDQEIIVVDKKVEALKGFQKAKEANRHAKFDHSAYYHRFHPEIDVRVAECLALRAKLQSEDAAGITLSRGSKKRKIVTIDDSDDEQPVFLCDHDDGLEEIGNHYEDQPQAVFSERLRSSPRKKQRIDYTEPHNILQREHNAYNQPPGYISAYPQFVPERQDRKVEYVHRESTNVHPSSISPNTRKTSFSEIFDTYEHTENDRPLTDKEIEFMLSLPRRKSSAMSIGPSTSIMKSPKLKNDPRDQKGHNTARTASFNAQPVSSSKEYNINGPPSEVASSHTIAGAMQEGYR
ncbi:hypothetical protein BKA66DRAFT_548189 [Pyrenochaeta sp. MPI-SDFR-AT-0127]|nr:hypothetical protein BKA66DRAFT_548189 [Pyrenochaeta sp. MPI-SDFR-AT-0127]